MLGDPPLPAGGPFGEEEQGAGDQVVWKDHKPCWGERRLERGERPP